TRSSPRDARTRRWRRASFTTTSIRCRSPKSTWRNAAWRCGFEIADCRRRPDNTSILPYLIRILARIAMATADVPAVEQQPAGAKDPEVNNLFRVVMKHGGSDLHLKAGLPPMMRLKGVIRRMDMRPLSQEDMERLLLPTLKGEQRQILDTTGGVD